MGSNLVFSRLRLCNNIPNEFFDIYVDLEYKKEQFRMPEGSFNLIP